MDKKDFDEELIEKLAQNYASMIRAICRRFYLVGGTAEDLYQEGMIGLYKAIKSYDLDKEINIYSMQQIILK